MEIVKVCNEPLPELRFIGKRCLCSPENFIKAWDDWYQHGWFDQLEKSGVATQNGNAHLGMTSDDGNCYWIGLLFPPSTAVPDGFEHEDIPAGNYAVIKIAGKNNKELLNEEGAMLCFKEMRNHNFTHDPGRHDFELYTRPFTERGKGKILFECMFAIK